MRIAIIGGGFSGTSLSAQLILRGTPPLSVYLCEKGNSCGLGVAYSTPMPWHLLNVRADHMGAFADDPDGFYKWLVANKKIWRDADPAFKKITLNKDAFLPRKLYGIYLTELLKETRAVAARQGTFFETIHNTVVDIEQTPEHSLRLIFSDDDILDVDKVVLATGVKPIKSLSFGIVSDRYIDNLWECDVPFLAEQISKTNKDSVIFIVGTGLTMVDMITSLDLLGYQGKIVALSHHGQLPSSHTVHRLAPMGNLEDILNAKGLLNKFHLFNNELFEVEMSGHNWRQLFDAIRPHTPELWEQLSLADKKSFLRHLSSSWNKHRHRMAPESVEIIGKLFQQRRLRLIGGEVLNINDGKLLEILYKKENAIEILKADFVYNCTGPDYSIKNRQEPIFKNLLKKGWISPDDLGLGIKSNGQFGAIGPLSEKLFLVGSLLFGDRFETTAAPGIAQETKKIANHLLLGLKN